VGVGSKKRAGRVDEKSRVAHVSRCFRVDAARNYVMLRRA
jgi:hypothetical protein